MSEARPLEKRPSRGNRLSRKQKTERVRRERINSALDELKAMVVKGDEKNDKMDKADILEATVNFVRDSREREYQQNPNFKSGYNQCVNEFVNFLVSLENVQNDDKAKLLAGMATILCGAKKPDQSTSVNNENLPTQKQRNQSGKIPISRLPRPVLQTVNTNVMSTSLPQASSLNSVNTVQPMIASVTSLSNRIPSSSSASSSSSSSCAELSPYMEVRQMSDSGLDRMLDSVFCETSGLETSLARAVGASLEVTDLSSITESESVGIEEMSLPSMCSFLF